MTFSIRVLFNYMEGANQNPRIKKFLDTLHAKRKQIVTLVPRGQALKLMGMFMKATKHNHLEAGPLGSKVIQTLGQDLAACIYCTRVRKGFYEAVKKQLKEGIKKIEPLDVATDVTQ